MVEAVRPEAVSFHFGLPDQALLARVKDSGAAVIGNATTVDEARWLAGRGVDAIIAQGWEAGGHRGWFLPGAEPLGLVALVPPTAPRFGRARRSSPTCSPAASPAAFPAG
jgi:nitronate monooxygenase